MKTDQRRIYLVDDDSAVREAVALLLQTVGFEVAAFADPMAFLAVLAKLEPGCVVLDIRMPMLSGLRLQERLAEEGCEWPVIVISGHGDIEACRRAFKNGAVDFLSKPVDEQDLIDAIQKADRILERRAAQSAERAEAQALLGRLTAREIEVLELVSRGFTSRQIAGSLNLSPRTIESHRASIAAKVGTTSPAELTRLLIDSGRDP